MNIYPASQQKCGRYFIASSQINGLASVLEVASPCCFSVRKHLNDTAEVINATFMLSFPVFPIVADAEKAIA